MGNGATPIDGTTWNSALRTPRILWAALLASTFVYAYLILGGIIERSDADPSFRWIFPGIALITSFLSFALPVLLARGVPKMDVATREEVDKGAESLFRDAATTHRVVVDPTGARAKYVARRQTLFILAVAMSETPAVFALAAWMVSDLPLRFCLAMVALSFVLIAIRFPFAARWRADAEKEIGAVIPN